MRTRRHHNNDGLRQVRAGKTREQVAHMARRIGTTDELATLRTRTEKMEQALREAQAALHDAWCEPDFHRTPCERATAALKEGE